MVSRSRLCAWSSMTSATLASAGQVQGEELPPPRRPSGTIQDGAEVEGGGDDEPQAVGVGHRGGAGGGADRIALLGHRRERPGLRVVQHTVDPGPELAVAYRVLQRGGRGERDNRLGGHACQGMLARLQDLVDPCPAQLVPDHQIGPELGQRRTGQQPGRATGRRRRTGARPRGGCGARRRRRAGGQGGQGQNDQGGQGDRGAARPRARRTAVWSGISLWFPADAQCAC